jgi:hypothetical protein
MNDKPKMQLLGQDGNIFAIMGRASALLRAAGQSDKAKEMFERVTSSGSYDEALCSVSEYVQTELSAPERPAPDAAGQPTKRKEKHNHHER